MARIHVPTKGTFRCDSSTAEDAVEYLRQVSLGYHLRSNALVCRDRMVLWSPVLSSRGWIEEPSILGL